MASCILATSNAHSYKVLTSSPTRLSGNRELQCTVDGGKCDWRNPEPNTCCEGSSCKFPGECAPNTCVNERGASCGSGCCPAYECAGLTGLETCQCGLENADCSGSVPCCEGFTCVADSCEADTDNDGVIDADDGCPDDPEKLSPGSCDCGNPETDSDSDGAPDCVDECDDDPLTSVEGECGCGVPVTDSDNDGTPDCIDDCARNPGLTAPRLLTGCKEWHHFDD